MNNVVLFSTLFLTVLLLIGLFFFLRASTKDRTQTVTWQLPASPEQVLQEVTQYLEARSYRLQSLDREMDEAIFQGVVGASWGLAIFLSLLAGVSAVCLGLVLAIQIPQVGFWGLLAIGFAPLTGWLYRKKAQRTEQVRLTVQDSSGGELKAAQATQATQTKLRVTAHRDEVESLRSSLNYPFPEY